MKRIWAFLTSFIFAVLAFPTFGFAEEADEKTGEDVDITSPVIPVEKGEAEAEEDAVATLFVIPAEERVSMNRQKTPTIDILFKEFCTG